MSRWFDERYITLYAILVGCFPIAGLFLTSGLLTKFLCGLMVLFIASHWYTSRRLLRRIEVLAEDGSMPSDDASKLWFSAGIVLMNSFYLTFFAWIVSMNFMWHLRHHH
jgi:hypothetical protein